jgi:hypothetical protein
MGHGIEVAFDFGEPPTWYHGEICGVAVDKIRVRYYHDNTRHWHRRFLMEHHGMEMPPVLVQATAGAAALAGVMSPGQYTVSLVAAGRQGVARCWTAGRSTLLDGRAYIAPATSST